MSEIARLGLSDPVATPSSKSPSKAASNTGSIEISPLEKNIAGAGKIPEEQLFAHRAVMAERAQQEAAARPLRVNLSRIISAALGAVVIAALAGVLILAAPTFFQPRVENLFVDLGTQKYEPAGLSGRLTAQWTGSAGYKLTINPLDPAQNPAFREMITNRWHDITFTVRLKDSTGDIACQKDIVIPGTQQLSNATKQSHALAKGATPTGDTIQNTMGNKGQVDEMDLAGPLPCTVEAYKEIVAWDFTTDFPSLVAQKKWKKQQDAAEEASKAQYSAPPPPRPSYSFVKSLPSPIDGNDVIVRDNQMKGVLATVGGHDFYVGNDVLDNPSLDWQLFPADVHYRCDRNALCTVTRLDSNSLLHARLIK